MKITTLTIALAFCLGLVAAGCAEDAETDEPEDGFVNDGPVNVNGSCNVQPYDCADLGDTKSVQNVGCCYGYTHYWCGNLGGEWVFKSEDCETCAPKYGGEEITCKAIVTTGNHPDHPPPETSPW